MLGTYSGSCHCTRVRFEVVGDLAETLDCNCSVCTKKGFLHLIVTQDRFRAVSGEDAMRTYRFGTGVARHMFCGICGISPYYVPRSDPDKIDVNVRCLDGLDLSQVRPKPFDGRLWEAAQAARARLGEGRK